MSTLKDEDKREGQKQVLQKIVELELDDPEEDEDQEFESFMRISDS